MKRWFGELNFHASYEPKRAVRTKRWKYIRRYDQRTHPVLANCDDGGNERFWAQYGGLGHLAGQSDQERQAALVALYRNKDCGAKDYWLQNGWAKQTVVQEGLYDLVFDPTESNNLAVRSSYRDVLAQMRKKLETWMHVTNDPLLKGSLIAPQGAILNSPDEISPLGRLEIVQ